jgi:hypothetical protein
MAMNHQPSVPPKSSKGSSWAETMHDDIVEEIHADRAALSQRFGGDMAAIIRYCQSLRPPIPVSKVKPQRRRIRVSK